MAFPTAIVGGGNTNANVTTHPLDFTAIGTPAAGDLLIVVFGVDGTPTISGWPAGWTSLASTSSGVVCTTEVRYKIATGGEGNFSLTTSAAEGSAHQFYRITASTWQGSTPPEISTAVTGSSTTPNPGSLDPANWATEDTLWIAASIYDTGQPFVSSYPSSYTTGTDYADARTAGVGVSTAKRNLAAASEDPGAFTYSATVTWIAFTIAVAPVGAAGGGTVAISASASGTGTALSSQKAARSLSARASALATDLATLSVSRPGAALSASASGVGKALSSLSVARKISGRTSGSAASFATVLAGSSTAVKRAVVRALVAPSRRVSATVAPSARVSATVQPSRRVSAKSD